MAPPTYFLGCPVWACERWVGSLYSTKERSRWLGEYSQVFNTVEGNSVFYALPPLKTVERWAAETQNGFQFTLKFPRSITHDARLSHATDETRALLDALTVLQNFDRLGPTFLQLPPRFSGRSFSTLAAYLRQLPREMPFAVEVRHRDFFENASHDAPLNELLFELGMDRVIFDSRALFSAPASDEYEVESQTRKPNFPVTPIATGTRPMLRFVGRNCLGENAPWIQYWAPVVAGWIRENKTPYVFAHTPDDFFAAEFALAIHDHLSSTCGEIASVTKPWPGQRAKRQRDLF